MAPVARGLADSLLVYEPFQRGSGPEPLTVSTHINDLHDLVRSMPQSQPALAGHSWGAMLVLAYAAAHPQSAGPLVLIGCGTFSVAARTRMKEILAERMNDTLRDSLQRIEKETGDPDIRLKRKAQLETGIASYALKEPEPDDVIDNVDSKANRETWADMIRLQEAGIYPQAFTAIENPVLMVHGAVDPHPGRMIFESLQPYLPQIEFHEWERCGHYPWRERYVREEFFALLRSWLASKTNHGRDRD
ncbi:MAG: alpha/beta hydrolase [Acidobacteria bacterium]|nr:alpha/beta hydrolase [Acidobacteriota bacterium]